MGLRDMFSAISGLQANSTWLDVIGNNISNSNTVAYKASRVEFADQISQTLFGGTGDNPGSNFGGVNPEQVGLGTRVASITTLFTEGTIQQTGRSTDIAITGNGFLIAKQGNQTVYTRAGNLNLDSFGNLVDQNGGLIQGFTAAIKYTNRVLDTRTVTPNIVDASLVLNNQNTAAIADITIKAGMVEPPHATQVMNMVGNLDSFQQANSTGGILNLGPAATPLLPIGLAAVGFDAARMIKVANGVGNSLGQQAYLDQTLSADPLNPTRVTGLITGAVDLGAIVALPAGTMAWDQQPPIPPAHTTVQTVYDSLGNARQITMQFYQVNDLGPGGINAPPRSQVAYAWYAFDTTNNAPVNTASLIGGSGLIEGDPNLAGLDGYDRGVAGTGYWGDLLYFNTDGSLGSMGAVENIGAQQTAPHLYLSPLQPAINPGVSPIPVIGAEVLDVTVNFGTAGMLTFGRRDGMFADAQGTYQVVNGVNTYVPNSTAFMKSQDGYTDGTLQGVQFDKTGTILGTFSNGQTTALGQVVMALPDNPEGMSKIGSNYFAPSPNAGPIFVGLPGQNGTNLGTIQGDSLEGSNVDLTVELSNMIIAQRGFGVNSRVIAVENSNLQVLTQLGQGG